MASQALTSGFNPPLDQGASQASITGLTASGPQPVQTSVTEQCQERESQAPLSSRTSWGQGVGHPDVQYRMAPSNASFPQRYFYGGHLKTHEGAAADTEKRRMIRAVAQKRGIKPGEGSEYWGINAPGGMAHVEPSSTSLQNYANVDIIKELVLDLTAEGIDPEDIYVLCFYKAETRLIPHRLASDEGGRDLYQEVSTVDAFHERRAPVVIVDFVVAMEMNSIFTRAYGSRSEHQSAIKQDPEAMDSVAHVPSFVRDPHRINVALTRAQDGLIIVAQFALFMDMRIAKGANNALFAMTEDLMDRELLCESKIIDTHPETERRLDEGEGAVEVPTSSNLEFIAEQIQRHRDNAAKAANRAAAQRGRGSRGGRPRARGGNRPPLSGYHGRGD
ncbi:MAG: hypothetical protein L6R39_001765 [Caloplaca ligustica]|nr:MAG: hypothetical protein L6R39_001765 [Caloplaca ligustica]